MRRLVAAVVAVGVLAAPAAAYAEDEPASDHTVCQEFPYGTPDEPCSLPAATVPPTTTTTTVAPRPARVVVRPQPRPQRVGPAVAVDRFYLIRFRRPW